MKFFTGISYNQFTKILQILITDFEPLVKTIRLYINKLVINYQLILKAGLNLKGRNPEQNCGFLDQIHNTLI